MLVKTWFMFHLPDMNDFPFMERWFPRYHAPEVMRRPLSIRYLGYRVVPPFPGVEHYGYYNYRVHENWSRGDGSGEKEVCRLRPFKGRWMRSSRGYQPSPQRTSSGQASVTRRQPCSAGSCLQVSGRGSGRGRRRLVPRRSCQGSHAAAGTYPVFQLPDTSVRGSPAGCAPGATPVLSQPLTPVFSEVASRLGAVVREPERVEKSGNRIAAGLHEAPMGHVRQVPLLRTERRFCQHFYSRMAHGGLPERRPSALHLKGRRYEGGSTMAPDYVIDTEVLVIGGGIAGASLRSKRRSWDGMSSSWTRPMPGSRGPASARLPAWPAGTPPGASRLKHHRCAQYRR